MKKFFLTILLSGYILCTSSFATTDSVDFLCNTASGLSKNIIVGASSNITVDWGDGIIQEIPIVVEDNYGENILSHTYSNMNRYNVSIIAEDIQKFQAVQSGLLTIDLSNAPSIRELYIDNNRIDSLNLSNNLELQYISCSNNYLSQLKIWSTNALEVICNNNMLSILDIPNTVVLLNVNNNNLSNLDLSGFSNLIFLECTDNNIHNLSIGSSTLLESLNFANNFVSNISLANNGALRELYCNSNELTSLNLSNNVNIQKIDCTYNKLSTINLNSVAQLKELYLVGNSDISTINLNNLGLELIVLDENTNITNNNSQCTIKISMSGDGGVIVSENKNLILSMIPYKISINEEDIVLEDNILDLSEYSGAKNINIEFYALGNTQDFDINEPQLLSGMIPIKYDGYSWIITNKEDKEWYNYRNKRWANVMLRDGAKYLDVDGVTLRDIGNTNIEDLLGRSIPEENLGSMYVWIPRFSFKIEDTGIDIEYSKGVVDYTENGYIVHPAFNYASYKGGDTSDNSNYEDISFEDKYLGMWVAKFAASENENSPKYAPNLEEIRNLSIENAFLKSKLTGTSSVYGLQNAKSHLIKNTEWGAVAYLTTAIGKIDSVSTTGNIYGIYNMNTNPEYVSTFIELVGGISNFSVRENGRALIPYAMLKYFYNPVVAIKDIDVIKLRKAQDSNGLNYNVFSKYYGIAMNEIDVGISGTITKLIPNEKNAFLIRGINGIYSYSNSEGISNNDVGFRNVIFGPGINSNNNDEYVNIVATSNYGGKVNPYGSITIKKGKNMTYSIIPYEGYEISDIIVDGVSEYYSSNYINHGTYSMYQFNNINSNHDIYIAFDNQVAAYNVSVEKYVKDAGQNENIAQIEGEGMHNSKSIVTLRAQPINGYKLLNWEVPVALENLETNTSNELTFKMPSADFTIKATFERILKTLLTVENIYSTVKIQKEIGDSVQVVAGEIDGYKFRDWSMEGLELTEEQKVNPSIDFIMPDNEVHLVANYDKLSPVKLILGDDTLVEFEGEETKEIILIAPVQVNNKAFWGWKIDGYVLDIGNSIVLTMPEDSINIETIYQ